jgi:hypothetical protein
MRRTIDDGTTGRRAGMPFSAALSPRWLGAAVIALGALATAEASLAQIRGRTAVAYSFDAANYWGTELQILSMTDPQGCALLCDQEPRCQVASLHDATVGGKYHNKCVLRSEPGARHPENAGVYSWSKASARSALGTTTARCDIRNTDWRNMSYPGIVLTNGLEHADPGFHTELQAKDIVYGDLRGDRSIMAFVPIYEGSDAEGKTNIFVVDADPMCKPRLLMTTGGQLNTSGKIVGASYLFERYDNELGGEVRIEVRWVGGRLVEGSAPQGAPPSTPSPPGATVPVANRTVPSPSPITPTATPAASSAPSPARKQPGVCELRRVDWKNVTIPGGLTFKRGTASSGETAWGPASEDCGLDKVEYADLDGNGFEETYLSIHCNPGQSFSSNDHTVAVVEMGPNCTLRLLTTIEGGPYGHGKGRRAFVRDGCRLLQGRRR